MSLKGMQPPPNTTSNVIAPVATFVVGSPTNSHYHQIGSILNGWLNCPECMNGVMPI